MSTLLSIDMRPQKVALLVGSNPLPNYLAAAVLSPKEVVLLYSPETLDPRDHLRAALSVKSIVVSEVCIEDATDVRKIHDACKSLQVDHLHYSGGTKPMAAHARAAVNLDESQASYLDERKGLLRYDDGYDEKLSDRDLGLTLDLVLALHGAERIGSASATDGDPSGSDVDAVCARVLSEQGLSRKLFEHFRPNGKRRNVTQAKGSLWKALDHGFALTAAAIPDTDWTKARYEAWDDFLCGGWLEHWTANAIRHCLDGSTAIEIGVRCKRSKPVATEFEIDVALIRDHRLHVISCTTEHEKKVICKSKLFEVAMRARQMGGDLARSALVCLLDGNDAKGTYVDQLRADIAGVWDAPNIPRVFGLTDLREWAGTSGEPNLSSLREWLDS
ncbi:Card1-like endonuclease domain-containing protein [Nitrosovibrio sp. Nv17]|uniref:Card1-like endonuclease domain-containing protein n=1 Tax=Nitrosovibrio sp. Nv17 TaxID=1855339 RepID=UPI0009090A4A|nr:DUF1887 family CARF protein [Nitrosovibrio sp. Nv17]SFW22836.1 protein of unknown function [Nitrosovibrio sp. Nv17]